MPWLKNVTFQKDLGSYYDKTAVQRLCSWTCELIRDAGMQVRPGVVHKAVCLSKTDLTTELVKEFTELQGIVGGLYARVQDLDHGMPDETCRRSRKPSRRNISPESAEDPVPRKVGAVLSIADKADTIAGMFALEVCNRRDQKMLHCVARWVVRTIAEHVCRSVLVAYLNWREKLIEDRRSKRSSLMIKISSQVAIFSLSA